jgi:hypothetical protein
MEQVTARAARMAAVLSCSADAQSWEDRALAVLALAAFFATGVFAGLVLRGLL